MADTFEEMAEVYKALGDKTRLHMLALLAKEELCVCELVSILGISQPGVSQHLRKLKQAGLVKERKTAQWVFYSLNTSTFSPVGHLVSLLPDVTEEINQLKSSGLRVQCN
ncbi:metalloregulator ArsR/SmtB family transcription factor [Alicyclobacillus tolerans]|uniref:ArsR/SmtB family transcription factor n=1 Tax=Alicyclobacillus tolerans TaxID=90970 RepID=UPI001F00F873|nr:metalloregulator ArsR/SmtB family transcription factor [Alicyclobacillus tolerans]MCF8566521.1 metalloregulator ArsR/SmtB family transcription factor [Alicyclobacillus tolerans]